MIRQVQKVQKLLRLEAVVLIRLRHAYDEDSYRYILTSNMG